MPHTKLRMPRFKLRTAHLMLTMPHSKLQTRRFKLRMPHLKLPMPRCKLQTSRCTFRIPWCGYVTGHVQPRPENSRLRVVIFQSAEPDIKQLIHVAGNFKGKEYDFFCSFFSCGTGSVQFRCERKYEAYALKSEQNRQLLHRFITD